MYPRQRLSPRCSAKPARHPTHPDVDPHAVWKKQLPLRLKEVACIILHGLEHPGEDLRWPMTTSQSIRIPWHPHCRATNSEMLLSLQPQQGFRGPSFFLVFSIFNRKGNYCRFLMISLFDEVRNVKKDYKTHGFASFVNGITIKQYVVQPFLSENTIDTYNRNLQ